MMFLGNGETQSRIFVPAWRRIGSQIEDEVKWENWTHVWTPVGRRCRWRVRDRIQTQFLEETNL